MLMFSRHFGGRPDIKMAIRLCAEKLRIWNSTYTWNKVTSENEALSEISNFSKWVSQITDLKLELSFIYFTQTTNIYNY